jgi:hypothetical protein
MRLSHDFRAKRDNKLTYLTALDRFLCARSVPIISTKFAGWRVTSVPCITASDHFGAWPVASIWHIPLRAALLKLSDDPRSRLGRVRLAGRDPDPGSRVDRVLPLRCLNLSGLACTDPTSRITD